MRVMGDTVVEPFNGGYGGHCSGTLLEWNPSVRVMGDTVVELFLSGTLQ